MMTTNHNYKSNEILNRNYAYINPNNTGQITNRTKNGPYNITEKDFGDHKVVYYIPSSYEDNYDLSQLDEEPFYQQQQKYYSPPVVRRRYYHSYDDDDDYVEQLPIISPRRHMYVSPRGPQVIKRIYYQPPSPPPLETIEYIYEDDYRPKNEEIIEYIVRDRTPRQRYIEEFQPIHQTEYVENLPPIIRYPRTPPPIPLSIKPFQLNELSPRRSKVKQQTPQTTPRKILSQNNTEQKHISLKDVVAQNRARRGSRIPKPRREVAEDEFYDLPTYNKNFIKNDFFVHK